MFFARVGEPEAELADDSSFLYGRLRLLFLRGVRIRAGMCAGDYGVDTAVDVLRKMEKWNRVSDLGRGVRCVGNSDFEF